MALNAQSGLAYRKYLRWEDSAHAGQSHDLENFINPRGVRVVRCRYPRGALPPASTALAGIGEVGGVFRMREER